MSLVFGIPTIKREKTSYLLDTLASLLDGMSQEDKDDCVIVIFVGEVNSSTYVYVIENTISTLLNYCPEETVSVVFSKISKICPEKHQDLRENKTINKKKCFGKIFLALRQRFVWSTALFELGPNLVPRLSLHCLPLSLGARPWLQLVMGPHRIWVGAGGGIVFLLWQTLWVLAVAGNYLLYWDSKSSFAYF